MEPFSNEFDVPVAGGNLRVALAGPARGAPVVLAIHGITASHRAWAAVARHLGDDVTLLVPDLRGRGQSNELPGPYGLGAHVDDMVAVLDHVGAPQAVVAGHSMGAYITARLAAAHPARVSGVVLVDGGLPLPVPTDVEPDWLLEAILGPALSRLRMTFADQEAYRDFWRAHPAFAGPKGWTADVEAYVDYDLVPVGPDQPDTDRRSRVSEVAVRGDGRDTLSADEPRRAFLALASIAGPTVLVRAPRGLLDEPNPLQPDAVVAEAKADHPGLVDILVDDTNHYLVLLGEREAGVVADQIRLLAGVPAT